MSLTMYGAPTRTNPPPYDHRTSGNTNTTSRTTRNYTMGASSSTSSGTQRAVKPTAYDSTYGSSYGTTSSNTSSRRLPNGPGPLPDRFTLDRRTNDVRYVSQYGKSEDRFPPRASYLHVKPSIRTGSIERKTSNDSGYGSSSSVRNPGTSSSSTLAGRRSKSYSNLNLAPPISNDRSPKADSSKSKSYNYSKTVTSYSTSYTSGMSSRTKTLENITKLDENCNIYLPSHDSDVTKRSDYSKTFSTSSSMSPTSPISTSPMTRKVIEGRKEVITATPASLRRSSEGSTSSSSLTPNGRGCTDGLVGLRNLGNTCFMNSILQCLSHSCLLTEYLLKNSHSKNINSKSSMKGKLIQAYAELIKSMWKPSNSETAISPLSFKTQIQRFAPRFVGYNQQDAQEFLRFLLEGLHDDLNLVHDKPKYKTCEFNDSHSDNEKAEKSWKHYLARDNSLITDLFVGQLKSTLKCTECNYKSVTFDPFWDLSLPIPRKSGSYNHHYDSRGTTIQDCMELFTKEEVLDGDERPTCEKCKKKRKSTKTFTIQRFPKILVLHLKRFSGFGFRSKLQTCVDFPTDSQLNLGQFASDVKGSQSVVYGLYAVSNHSGTTYAGHYTAYCKHPQSRQWHCLSDSSVDDIPLSRVGGSQAYILFYERLDTLSKI